MLTVLALWLGTAVLACAPATIAGTALASAASPEGSSEGRLLVLNKHDNTLQVFDLPSNRLLATIAVGEEPHEVVVTPDGRKAYTANVRADSLSVVDLRTYRVVRTIRSENLKSPHGLGVTPDGRHLLVTSEGSRRIFLIDAVRDVVLRSITTTQNRAHMLVILKGGRRACVANVGSDSLTLLDLPGLRIVRNVKVGTGPEGIAAVPNGRWVLVALQGTDQVAILDASSHDVLARLPTGQTPIRIAVTPNSFTALVTNRASDDVTVIDVLGRRVRSTIRVGKRPGGLVTDARGMRAYVANNESNSVSIVSLAGFEVTGTIATGAYPDGIAFVPAGAAGEGRTPSHGRPPKPGRRS
ncbi:MAG TPA: hypothetical protein VFT43_01480 [Candidatus Polarisedimenticolia bacterium]|nr:hypothetical protein [Candidatus Polarisedimenticolia bacterium]